MSERVKRGKEKFNAFLPFLDIHYGLTFLPPGYSHTWQPVQNVLINGMSHDLGWIEKTLWVPGDDGLKKPPVEAISRFVTLAIGSSTTLVAEMPTRSLAMIRRVLCFQLEDMAFTLDSPALRPGVLSTLEMSGRGWGVVGV